MKGVLILIYIFRPHVFVSTLCQFVTKRGRKLWAQLGRYVDIYADAVLTIFENYAKRLIDLFDLVVSIKGEMFHACFDLIY